MKAKTPAAGKSKKKADKGREGSPGFFFIPAIGIHEKTHPLQFTRDGWEKVKP